LRTSEFARPTWDRGDPPSPTRLRAPVGLLSATSAALREAGAGGREGLVLWAGRPDGGESVLISHLIEPEAEGEEDWLRVTIAARAEVLALLRADDLLVVADVHSHPFAAFLSPVDAHHPYSARIGHLAVVVPDLGRGTDMDGWRAFEFSPEGWIERDLGEVIDGRL
jgi:proteasome lid subunit RPN8/RPN11